MNVIEPHPLCEQTTMDLFLLLLLVLWSTPTCCREITVVEGLSQNINILCDLDRGYHPLYWNIQGEVYELYNVPAIFSVRDYEAITLATVDRRMNGWRLQCFAIGEEGLLSPGLVSILTVIYDTSTEGPENNADLLQSSLLGRLILNYQALQFATETVTLDWLYSSMSAPCSSSGYEVAVYAYSEIQEKIQTDLVTLMTFSTGRKKNTITIDSQYLKDSMSERANYFKLENDCATSAYYYDLSFNGTREDVYVRGVSATFEMPVYLRNRRSVQLIWSKDANTRCVCPPVEQFIAQCACNAESRSSNVITITDNYITVSNLSHVMGEGELILYFVSSVSNGCMDTCNLRSIEGIYRIIITQGYPQPPVIDYINTQQKMFCFTIPNNPIDPEVYEVNLTDSTGSLTGLTGTYNISRCLSITSDLYPDMCGPFQLSIAAVNSVGREFTETLILNETIEPNPCGCYEEKAKVFVTSTSTFTSVDLTLHCDYSQYRDPHFTIGVTINENNTAIQVATLSCNSTIVVTSLKPATSYSIKTVLDGSRLTCSLHQFKTNQESITDETETHLVIIIVPSILSTAVLIVLLLLVLIVVIYCKRRRSYEISIQDSKPKETPLPTEGGLSPKFRFSQLKQ